jgi:putative transposase
LIRHDGSRHLLAFMRSQGEGQADWEGLLQDLYQRGLQGRSLGLILTSGCAGLAAAIRTVYPRGRHQRCWVHKMWNILEKAWKRDYDEVKAGAQRTLIRILCEISNHTSFAHFVRSEESARNENSYR